MVTAPLFVVLLLITGICLKGKVAKTGSVILGALLGLTLAPTAVGAATVTGLTSASAGLVSVLSSFGSQG